MSHAVGTTIEITKVNLHPQLMRAMEDGIFWITKRIAIGQFASLTRGHKLMEAGVTHILNVSDCESLASTTELGFRQVTDVTVVDLTRLPDDVAINCLNTIHTAMFEPDTKLYIHCSAGQNRSPSVLWLYLLALGMEREEATRLIVERCPDAVPGHSALVDDDLVAEIRSYGRAELRPLDDSAILEPAY